MRHKLRTANITKILLTSVIGVFLFLASFGLFTVYSYTRAGGQARVSAAVPMNLNFQARLLQSNGSIVPDGTYSIEFNLYTSQNGGSSVWAETHPTVQVKSGYLSVYLGDIDNDLDTVDWSQQHWLTMNVGGDGEMNPRLRLTSVPYAFRSSQADGITNGTGILGANDIVQIAPSSVQAINTALAALRINQTGSGLLAQLQGDGSDVFTISKNGNVTSTGSGAFSGGIQVGNSLSTSAGTIRWNGTDFEGFDGLEWKSFTSGGGGTGSGNANATASFVSGLANVGANITGTPVEMLLFTSATAVSNTVGSTGFTAPADGSFRTCLVKNNANVTAGTLNVRWRVNGTSVGAGVCTMNSTTNRQSAGVIDPGVVTFSAGDTIGIAFDTSGMSPTTNDFTVYWTVEYNASAGGSGGASTLQEAYDNSSTPAAITTSDGKNISFRLSDTTVDSSFLVDILSNSGGKFAVQNDGSDIFSVTSSGVSINELLTVGNGLDLVNSGIVNAGSITGVGTDISANAALTISSGAGSDLTLSPGSGLLVLNAGTLQRTASGTTTIEINDLNDTTLSLLNTDATSVANLSVEGLISALEFSGDGGGLTALDAGNITSGSLDDARLSSNVALLNTAQTFSALATFGNGLVLNNTINTTAGTLRWTGSDFEGYDGTQWVSLTSGSGGGGGGLSLLEGILAFGKINGTTGAAFSIDGATVFRNSTGYYTVTLSSAATSSDYIVQLTAEEPSSSLDDINISLDNQTTTTFDVYIREGDNGTGADTLIDKNWHFVVLDPDATAGGSSGQVFTQNGNSFGTKAIFGTTDTQGLDIITDGSVALAFDSGGLATFSNQVSITNGGLNVIGNSSITGTFGVSNTLTISSGGLIVSGGIENNNGGITNTGSLSGVTSLTASGAISASTTTDTINGLVINAGSLSNVTGITFTSGTLDLANGGISNGGALSGITTIGANGLATLSGGATISGAAISLNENSNFATNINTGSSSGVITIGGGSAPLIINSTAFDVSGSGAVSGVTTLNMAGAITAATAGNTINGLIINSGALSGITTLTASGTIEAVTGYIINGAAGASGNCSNNNVRGQFSGGIATTITCGGLSDARLKENVVSLDSNVLDKLQQVNTVTFDFKCHDEEYSELHLDCNRQTGVIAQELAQVFPELVYQEADGFFRVNYDALNIYTLKATSELAKTVDSNQNVMAQSVSTGNMLRLSDEGVLQNITGIKMLSGGASVIGGIDNNSGGISETGTITGATLIEATKLSLTASEGQNMLELNKNGDGVFTVFDNGALELRLDAQNAFAVRTSGGGDVFSVNTNGGLVQIGSSTADQNTVLLVLDSKSTEGDPAGVNGAQYYNQAAGKFRCYQNNKWQDCLPAATVEYVLTAQTHSWTQYAGESELTGNPRTWIDLSTAREFRLQTTVNSASTTGSTCRIQYTLDENSNNWSDLAWGADSGVSLDKSGAVRGEWLRLSPGVQDTGEVLVRVMCRSTHVQTGHPSITGLRMQLR